VVVASTTVWYAARAGGIVAYLLLSASVLGGILLAGKRHVPGLPRFAVEDVHRFLGLLAGLFIVVHVGSIALDTFVPFSLTQLVVPFTSSYRPLATGLGIVALELLLAVAMTNLLRKRLPYRLWRRAHYATLAVWLLATVHGILAGTDRDQAWLIALYAVTVALVTGAGGWRFGRNAAPRRAGTAVAGAACALVAVLVLAALPQAASRSGAAAKTAVAVPELNGSLNGTIDQSNAGILSISGTAAAGSAFRIDLLTDESGSVSDSALQVRFPGGATCDGTLSRLDQTGFAGTCSIPGSGTRAVSSTWTVSDGTVAGTIATSAARSDDSA
jgi:methionine sulfoxide reductase heme-binding subunit